MRIRFRDAEACEPAAQTFIWDTVWINGINSESVIGGYGDWILAGPGDPTGQLGGFRARMQLATAVVLQLFSDRRLPEELTAPGDARDDPRGWWGNSLRLDGEPDAEMGSLLWTLEREPLTQATADLARVYCEQALEVITNQGAVGRFEVETSVDIARGFLGIEVRAYDHVGNPALAEVYEVLWQQMATPAQMTYAR